MMVPWSKARKIDLQSQVAPRLELAVSNRRKRPSFSAQKPLALTLDGRQSFSSTRVALSMKRPHFTHRNVPPRWVSTNMACFTAGEAVLIIHNNDIGKL